MLRILSRLVGQRVLVLVAATAAITLVGACATQAPAPAPTKAPAAPAATTAPAAPAKAAEPTKAPAAATAAPAPTKAAAAAPAYPTKTITNIVWAAAGSSADVAARAMAPLLSRELGQTVVIENKTGGGGVVGVNELLSRPADGYTILRVASSLATMFGEEGVTFKPDDLEPLFRTEVEPYSLNVPGNSPHKTLKDLLDYAKANPKKLKVGGPFAMGAHRIHWERLADTAKVEATWIPFDSSGDARVAVAGGQIDASSSGPGDVKAERAAGKVRILGVSGDKRAPGFEDVPTYKDQGVDLVLWQWNGWVTRKGVPQPVIDRLVAAFEKAAKSPEWQTYLKNQAAMDGSMPAAQFKPFVLEQVKIVDDVKKKLGL